MQYNIIFNEDCVSGMNTKVSDESVDLIIADPPYFKVIGEKNRFHPTQKPLDLIKRIVLASSNENDLILDPFMGSGTTTVACIENNRKYIGFEMNNEYYQKSIERLNNTKKGLSN